METIDMQTITSNNIITAPLEALAAQINAHHERASVAARTAIGEAFEAGRLLIEAKSRLAHGEWLPWLKSNCACSERSARNYMKLAEAKDQIGNAADLSIRKALQLLEGPKFRPWPEVMPTAAGHFRVSLIPEYARPGLWWVVVVESPEHPGFYYVATAEPFTGEATDRFYVTREPIAAEAIRSFVGHTRCPTPTGEIENSWNAPWKSRNDIPFFSYSDCSICGKESPSFAVTQPPARRSAGQSERTAGSADESEPRRRETRERRMKLINGEKRGRPGRWMIDYRDQHGVRHNETFATMKEAKAAMVDRAGEVKGRTYCAPAQLPTFQEVAEAWLTAKGLEGLRPSTIAGLENHVHDHILPAQAAENVSETSENIGHDAEGRHCSDPKAHLSKDIVGSHFANSIPRRHPNINRSMLGHPFRFTALSA